jgi:hypothetical protein
MQTLRKVSTMTLSSVTSSSTQTIPEVPSTPAKTADSSATTAKAPEDKVELSAAAQAKSLKHQGQSVAQIASNLALTTKTVDDYLGITDTSSELALATLVQIAKH